MSTFEIANQALRRDMAAYATALATIVRELPRARELCDRIVKETRLAQALLAFASGPEAAELGQIVYQLANLWPYRERSFARTLGFDEEIAEARARREDAQRGMKLLARHGSDLLASEVTTCLTMIAGYLEEEQRILEECHRQIHPHAQNVQLTRKRLDLLIAAIDARLPESPSQQATLRAYSAAAETLRSWESGVPLDDEGIAILERCIASLEQADHLLIAHLSAAQPAGR